MIDVPELGRRPVVRGNDRASHAAVNALSVCPGNSLTQHEQRDDPRWDAQLFDAWGPVLEVWEGHASDEQIRYQASSGGAATALALHCLLNTGTYGVLHITARPDVPYLNHTVLSRTRSELLSATGSRYAPASPCDRLDLIERAPAPCVFIGKPCDVAALEKVRRQRPALDRNIALTIAIFCAGTPSTAGTLEMMRAMGVKDPDDVRSVRYRGKGWPGAAEVQTVEHGRVVERTLTYDQSWGEILQRHRPWRCHVCADHTGEFADISVGDPWYREIPDGEPGRSLVMVRTDNGRRVLHAALERGHVVLEPKEHRIIADSQPNLLRARGAVWGRTAASRMSGIATPRYRGMPIGRTWLRALNPTEKLQSFLGTVKRIAKRRLFRRRIIAHDLQAHTSHSKVRAYNESTAEACRD